jgi:shikimate dehydrogenase
MHKLGLLGSNISHSRSQAMYEKILNEPVDYSLLDYQAEHDIPPLSTLFNQGFEGLSITYPYKQTFIKDVVIGDDSVRKLNAINCLRRRDEIIEGTNTDFLAAEKLLNDLEVKEFSFLILGSGNMARVFELYFERFNIEYEQVSRHKNGNLNELNYLELLSDEVDIKRPFLINCCSRDFVFKANLPKGSVFWDMNYSFPEHEKLSHNGVKYQNGLDLLFWQAKFAASFWGIKPL